MAHFHMSLLGVVRQIIIRQIYVVSSLGEAGVVGDPKGGFIVHEKGLGLGLSMRMSRRVLRSHAVCCTAALVAMYSASQVESAVIF